MILTCYIIDDEDHAIEILSKYIEKTPGLQLIGASTNPLEALDKITSNVSTPDITFLDVGMSQLPGIELAMLIGDRTRIIFATGFPDYAVRAFDENALDYLLKPITYERFLKSISKVRGEISSRVIINEEFQKEDFFFIQSETKGKLVKINYDQTIYIEAALNYLKIHEENNFSLTYLTLKELLEKLPPERFVQVHKSFIINKQKVKAVENNKIVMTNQTTVDIGASYRDHFLNSINSTLIKSKRNS